MNLAPQPPHHVVVGPRDAPPVVYGHGWGRSHLDYIPAAESLSLFVRSHLLDLPGFGASSRPPGTWGSADYADLAADYIRAEIGRRVVWVGHSFGGRIGLQLAVRHPHLLSGMVLIASAGVPRSRTALDRIKGRLRAQRFKLLKRRARSPRELDELERRFGSPDYVDSKKRGMRDIFLKVVNENQESVLPSIIVPTHFIYGENDRETPPELGFKMASLIMNSSVEVLPEFDHHSILSRGYHIVARRVVAMALES